MILRLKNSNSGVILIVTIWMLIILTLLAVGIGHRNSIGIKLYRYSIDKLKSYYIAKAGIQLATKELEKDTANPVTKEYDTLYQCGISLSGDQVPEDIFKEKPLGEGFYDVSYGINNPEKPKQIYGLIDEERKINLNAINSENYLVLEKLLELLEVDAQNAKTIACAVSDWQDDDSEPLNAESGAEDDYYMGQEKPYHCKNSKFESLNELSLIRGMSKDIFLKIKDYITIYPFEGNDLKVNANTVDKITLVALARAAAELDGSPQTNQEDADNLADKIVDYRAGDDNIELTADDEKIDLQNPGDLDLFGAEESLFVFMKFKFLVPKSDYFRVKVRGVYEDKKVASGIEVVLSRFDLFPLYWHEE